MQSITARNVNTALPETLWWLHVAGVMEQSRNGPVRVAPEPFCITYQRPTERVLFNAVRDANPFFHFFEALWMLAGRDDVAFVAQFNKRMNTYSDDGIRLHGAYGRRWRRPRDQLHAIINLLRADPLTRRAVLQIWDSAKDLWTQHSKDLPCNAQAFFDVRNGALNMMVCNRSNDAVWGLLGANAVHFSFLQEYIAAGVGVPVGVYRQFTNNLHIYTENEVVRRLHFEDGTPHVAVTDFYSEGAVQTLPLLQPGETLAQLDTDLHHLRFLDTGEKYVCRFFNELVVPMYALWQNRQPTAILSNNDWYTAGTQWCARRRTKQQ